MANEEHARLILQGVRQWNTWRRENHGLDLLPDLSGMDFMNRNLIGVNFASTNLTGVSFAFAHLGGANLVGANLTDAILQRSNLGDANLTRANLAHADLTEALLVETLLEETDFLHAVFAHTVLANLDLRGCKHLDTITHKEPSTLGIDTIMRSRGVLPKEFLQGVGLNERFITFLDALDYSTVKSRTMGKTYYTSSIDHDGAVEYLIVDDPPTSLEEMWIRRTTEVPQGLTYLDPEAFMDKLNEVYVANR